MIDLKDKVLVVYEYDNEYESIFYFDNDSKGYICINKGKDKVIAELVKPIKNYLSIKMEKNKLNIKEIFKDSFKENKVFNIELDDYKIEIISKISKKELPKRNIKWY